MKTDSGLGICYHSTSAPILKSSAVKTILLNASQQSQRDRQQFDYCDDDGINISRYNCLYAELTGLYYLWHNIDAPYYGLFHYRRLLDLSGLYKHAIQNLPFTDWQDTLDTHYLNNDHIEQLITKHRLILPHREIIHSNLTVEGHYRAAHRGKDLDLLIQTAEKIEPAFASQLKRTLSGKSAYYCTVFIAEPKLFRRFCGIIFPILEAMLPHLDLESHELQPGQPHARVFGFLGERLLTAFVDFSTADDPSLSPLHVARTILNFRRPDFSTKRVLTRKLPRPKVSVVLPCYNVSEYLPHTFECLRAQTEESIEIIAIDDGSTDNTGEIIKHYSRRDNRIISLTHANCGLGATRNAGVSVANGNYIHFFDPDDYLLPTFYESLLRSGQQHDADIVMSSHCVIEPHTPAWDSSPAREAYLPAALRFGPNPTTASASPSVFLAHTPVWDKLFKASFLHAHNIHFYPIKAEDIPYTWEAYIRATVISINTNLLYYYRNRLGSITGSYGCFQDVFEAVAITEQWLTESDNLAQYASHWALKKFVSCAYGMYKIPDYLFSNIDHGYQYCLNLSNLINVIDPSQIDVFRDHCLYRDWVRTFLTLKTGNIFSNVVNAISKCTPLPTPDFTALLTKNQKANTMSGRLPDTSAGRRTVKSAPNYTAQSNAVHQLKHKHKKALDRLEAMLDNSLP